MGGFDGAKNIDIDRKNNTITLDWQGSEFSGKFKGYSIQWSDGDLWMKDDDPIDRIKRSPKSTSKTFTHDNNENEQNDSSTEKKKKRKKKVRDMNASIDLDLIEENTRKNTHSQ